LRKRGLHRKPRGNRKEGAEENKITRERGCAGVRKRFKNAKSKTEKKGDTQDNKKKVRK